jgi:hypothetical protein
VKLDVGEGIGAGLEEDIGAGALGLADGVQGPLGLPVVEFLAIGLAIPVDGHDQTLGERVHHGDADAVQSPGNLVGVVVELTAGVEHGHDDLGGGAALVFVDIHGDAAAVVDDTDRLILVDDDVNLAAVPGEGFVDGVVDGLEHHMVQSGPVVGVSDVHSRPLSYRVQALENLDIG